MKEQYEYSIEKAFSDLNGKPSSEEINRLVRYYPSYTEKDHRAGLLRDVLGGSSPKEMGFNKALAKGEESKGRKLGPHVRWAIKHMQVAVMRLLYLRYRIDENLTRRKANTKVFTTFPASDSAKYDSQKAKIRSKTSCRLLDR